MITLERKDTLYSQNEELISIIWALCGGFVMHSQLIRLLEELQFANNTSIKKSILELIQNNFLSKKQVLNTNRHILYLTGYPLSRLLEIPSANAPAIPSSNKAIIDSIFRCELIINILSAYRSQIGNSNPLDLTLALKILNSLNTTVHIPLRQITDYLDNLNQKYGSALSSAFREETSVLKTIKNQKINALSKYQTIEIDPDELRLKEDYDYLKQSYTVSQLNQSLYNFSNLKNSSSDIHHLKNNGRYWDAGITIYETRNMSVTRICEIAAWAYLALQRYNSLPEQPSLKVYVYLCNEDQKEYYEEEVKKEAVNHYGYRRCTHSIELLKNNGVRFPYCETNIEFKFRNLHLTDHYHISLNGL